MDAPQLGIVDKREDLRTLYKRQYVQQLSAHIVPFYECYALPHEIMRLDLAGRDPTEDLMQLLTERAYPFNTFAVDVIARDGKTKLGYSAFGFVTGCKEATEYSDNVKSYEPADGNYADHSLTEEDLIKNGQHVLVAYNLKLKAGYVYLATTAHFAAESSIGTNVNVCTTHDFNKTAGTLAFYIDPESVDMKIVCPTALFDRIITDGRAMKCSELTWSIGNNQGMGDVDYGKIYDIYFPPQYLRLFDGPSCYVIDMWRILDPPESTFLLL